MRQHKGPHRIRIDGPVIALALPFYRLVAVQAEHQHIALRLAAFQKIHMPRMQDIVTPVGEDDFFAFLAQGVQFFQKLGHINHAGMSQHIHHSSFVPQQERALGPVKNRKEEPLCKGSSPVFVFSSVQSARRPYSLRTG